MAKVDGTATSREKNETVSFTIRVIILCCCCFFTPKANHYLLRSSTPATVSPQYNEKCKTCRPHFRQKQIEHENVESFVLFSRLTDGGGVLSPHASNGYPGLQSPLAIVPLHTKNVDKRGVASSGPKPSSDSCNVPYGAGNPSTTPRPTTFNDTLHLVVKSPGERPLGQSAASTTHPPPFTQATRSACILLAATA